MVKYKYLVSTQRRLAIRWRRMPAAPATAAAVSLVNQSPVRIAGSFEVRVEDLAVMPSLESALSESMQGSLSNELDEQTFNGAAGELNGLFTQAGDESVASCRRNLRTTGIGRFAALVDGKHAYTLADVRAVIGSKTFALVQPELFANSNKGDMSLFDYLTQALGSIRVSDRVPGVSSSAQRCICVLTASAEMPKIHVWDAMQIVRDPYSGAGSWQGHDHRDGAGQSPLHSSWRGTGEGSSPEAYHKDGPMSEHHRVVDTTLECREATGSPGRLVGLILPVGRVAGDRPELFVGSGVSTPREGIRLLPEHRSSTVVMRFDPIVASRRIATSGSSSAGHA